MWTLLWFVPAFIYAISFYPKSIIYKWLIRKFKTKENMFIAFLIFCIIYIVILPLFWKQYFM
jgi:hypothetical protein